MILKRTMTAEDLLALPEDGRHYELVRGDLRMMSPAGFEHGSVVTQIAFLLNQHVAPNQLGRVLTGGPGFTLERNPDTVRAPDVAFVSIARIPPKAQQRGFPEMAPDLAVEVISPNDRRPEIEEKVRDYLQAGVRMIWLVRPDPRTVEVHRPQLPVATFSSEDYIDGLDVLPGFRCRVAQLFG